MIDGSPLGAPAGNEDRAIAVFHWVVEAGFVATLPLAIALLWLVFRGRRPLISSIAMVPVLLALYAYWVEPRLLLTSEHRIEICGGGLPGTLRMGVISDLHLGTFANAMPADRVAARLSRSNLDLVLMPGDFTYFPDLDTLEAKLSPFEPLPMPVYAVMGNHDVGIPRGPDLTAPLSAALERSGVTVLNPGVSVFRERGHYLRIVGLRDLEQTEKTGLPLGAPEASPIATILLEHNPDTALRGDVGRFELMVAGHTHGGQVYIPGVTCALTFACDTLRYGYADSPAGKLFVTSGTGMVGLPIRFAVPPRIDVLNLTIDRCPIDGRRARANRAEAWTLAHRLATTAPWT